MLILFKVVMSLIIGQLFKYPQAEVTCCVITIHFQVLAGECRQFERKEGCSNMLNGGW